MKELENLRWSPRWVSHLGCVGGCLDYLGLNVSDGWLYGATGHAFVINVGEVLCPSGPTAWNTEMLFALAGNVGYEVEGVLGFRERGDLAEAQARAWEHVRRSIDRGLPCYGWELDIPEFYVIYGYDHEGYYFSGPGCDEGRGPKPWQELGETGIGVVEVYSVEPGQAADDRTTVEQAISMVLEHAESPAKWIFPDYKAGLAGFDVWIRAVEGGTAGTFGMGYNAAVWAECRRYAVAFLEEARARIDGKAASLFDEAIGHYRAVSQGLDEVAKVYPFSQDATTAPIGTDERSRAAAGALKTAREAEAAGLEALARIAAGL
jgi:hypothetical protein